MKDSLLSLLTMEQKSHQIPVVTLDGPSGVGKGTVGLLLARRLNWHFLDSGVLYRLLAWEAVRVGIALDSAENLAELAHDIIPEFRIMPDEIGQKAPFCNKSVEIVWKGQVLTEVIRDETWAAHASKLAVDPQVRSALLETQRAFLRAPGLVADGRDMGTVVFPDSPYKFFLTATAEERARRRYLQLKQEEKHVSLDKLKASIVQRDERDQKRKVAALEAAEGACIIDTTSISTDQVLSIILNTLSYTKEIC